MWLRCSRVHAFAGFRELLFLLTRSNVWEINRKYHTFLNSDSGISAFAHLPLVLDVGHIFGFIPGGGGVSTDSVWKVHSFFFIRNYLNFEPSKFLRNRPI